MIESYRISKPPRDSRGVLFDKEKLDFLIRGIQTSNKIYCSECDETISMCFWTNQEQIYVKLHKKELIIIPTVLVDVDAKLNI